MKSLEVSNLWKLYGDRVVLENLNLRFDGAGFVTIVGASGCGKSTFLRLLLGQEAPSRGHLRLDGRPLAPEPGRERGVVFQRYSVFPHLTVLDNVMLGLELDASPVLGRLLGPARRRARERAREMLALVGLERSAAHYPATLSGGMQQRLALAQSLVMEPGMLLLDEPFGALDPGIRRDMHALVLDLWQRRSIGIFMVTHDLHEGFALGTRLLVFDRPREDPQAPERYGATVTYDLSPERSSAAERRAMAAELAPAGG